MSEINHSTQNGTDTSTTEALSLSTRVTDQLKAAILNSGQDLIRRSMNRLIDDSATFRGEVPRLLSWALGENKRESEYAIAALGARAHWISSYDLNSICIDALEQGVVTLELNRADRLVQMALLSAPDLNVQNVLTLGSIADTQFRDDQARPLSSQVALSLLGERMVIQSRMIVNQAIHITLQDYREALEHERPADELRHPSSMWRFKAASAGLFAQRDLIAGRFSFDSPSRSDDTLIRECRKFVFAMEDTLLSDRAPEWGEHFPTLLTAFVVDPWFDRATRESLVSIQSMIKEDLPLIASLISKLMGERKFTPMLNSLLKEGEFTDPEREIALIVAAMETTIKLERAPQHLSEPEMFLLHDELATAVSTIRNPFSAFYLRELQRAIRQRIQIGGADV